METLRNYTLDGLVSDALAAQKRIEDQARARHRERLVTAFGETFGTDIAHALNPGISTESMPNLRFRYRDIEYMAITANITGSTTVSWKIMAYIPTAPDATERQVRIDYAPGLAMLNTRDEARRALLAFIGQCEQELGVRPRL